MSMKLICLPLLVAACSFATFGQTAKNNPNPADWPSTLPERVIHGRAIRGQFSLDEGSNTIPGVVKIRVGVNKYADVATMKVLSGDKALTKDAKSFLVKCKFPKAPEQNRNPLPDWANHDNPDYPEPYYGNLPRFQGLAAGAEKMTS